MNADRFFLTHQQIPRMTQVLVIPIVLVVLSSAAWAQIEPAQPGSVEYSLISNNQWWIATPEPINAGNYVQDLLTDRWNQPAGRGLIGIVSYTAFDQDYGVMAAMVDFGRDYSVGIVFPELTAVQIVPEPSTLLLVVASLVVLPTSRRKAVPHNRS